jgi:hypothetical protein
LIQSGGKGRSAIRPTEDLVVTLPRLLVCGSRASWDRRAAECAAAGVPVLTFPPLFCGKAVQADELSACAERAGERLKTAGRLLLGIGPVDTAVTPTELAARLAELTALVLAHTPAATLLVEGGATAAALAGRLGLQRMAIAAMAPAGIGALKPIGVESPCILMKPGSYPWPEAVWQQLTRVP